jgi:hypothetical protein
LRSMSCRNTSVPPSPSLWGRPASCRSSIPGADANYPLGASGMSMSRSCSYTSGGSSCSASGHAALPPAPARLV